MKVAVVGAGVVGVATAQALVAAGHQVTVFERQSSVACEASFAHSGVLVGHLGIDVLAGGAAALDGEGAGCSAPGFRAAHLRSASALSWLNKRRRAGRSPALRVAALQLSEHARRCHGDWAKSLRLDFEQHDGAMLLLSGPKQQRRAEAVMGAELSRVAGAKLLDAEQARRLEPALCDTAPLLGAWRWSARAVGNCRQWAQLVKHAAQQQGVRFAFGTQVAGVQPQAQPEIRLTGGQQLVFDAVVICAGVGSSALLRGAGVTLPLMPIYGYALTASIRRLEGRTDNAPVGTVIDPALGVAITRLGQRLRVAGLAELGAPSATRDKAAMKTLYAALDRWFPGAAARQTVQHWKGARASLPDGLPAIGESGLPGVWLNTGHGAGNWAWCAGSAELLAARLSGRDAAIDMAAFAPTRWR